MHIKYRIPFIIVAGSFIIVGSFIITSIFLSFKSHPHTMNHSNYVRPRHCSLSIYFAPIKLEYGGNCRGSTVADPTSTTIYRIGSLPRLFPQACVWTNCMRGGRVIALYLFISLPQSLSMGGTVAY